MTREEKRTLAKRAASQAQGAGKWKRADCPFCELRTGKADHRQSFGVNSLNGFYHCFKCGSAGTLDGKTVVWEPASDAELDARDQAARKPPEGFLPLWKGDGARALCTREVRTYLQHRGISEQLIAEAQIGACTDGRYAGRVIVPILDTEGSWLGWVGRLWERIPGDVLDSILALGGSANVGQKYLYPVGLRRAEILYNPRALLVETDEPLLLVEGVFDSLALWPGSSALLGEASLLQEMILAAASRPIAVVLDGDAHEKGWALAMRLRIEGARAGAVKLPPRTDPDEVPLDWLKEEARRCLDA